MNKYRRFLHLREGAEGVEDVAARVSDNPF